MLLNDIIEENIKLVGCRGAKVKCILCSNTVELTNSSFHDKQKKAGDHVVFCKFCWGTLPQKEMSKKIQETNMISKYGVSNLFRTREGQERCRQRMVEKYGAANPSLVPDLKEKQLLGKQKLIGDRTISQIGARKAYETRKERYELTGAVPADKSRETCLQKYGAETYFGSSEGKMSLENFIKRYGEEGAVKYKQYCKNHAVSEEKMIKKYGENSGRERYARWKISTKQNYENFVSRWGEEDGAKKFNDFVTNFLRRTRTGSTSKISQLFFDSVCFPENPLFEEVIFNYSVDCLLPKHKIIIEFNGTFWHADPRFYKAEDKIKFTSKAGTTAQDIWKKDNTKKRFLESLGYTVMHVWEYDYYRNPQEEKSKLEELLNDRYK